MVAIDIIYCRGIISPFGEPIVQGVVACDPCQLFSYSRTCFQFPYDLLFPFE